MYQQDQDNGHRSGNFFMKIVLLLLFFAVIYFAYKHYHPDLRAVFGKSVPTERLSDAVEDSLALEDSEFEITEDAVKATEKKDVAKQTKESVKATARETAATEEKVAETPVQQAQKTKAGPIPGGKHLTFKGVPINGTLSQFVSKMEAAGFKRTNKNYEDAKKGQVKLAGDFAGYNNCNVFVSTQSQLDLVCKIRVEFPQREHWEDLYGDYKSLKNLLTEKYGSPKSVIEKTSAIYRDSPRDLMRGIENDHNTYKTTFGPTTGTIIISLTHDDIYDPYVCLEYFDAENMKAEKNLALSDL